MCGHGIEMATLTLENKNNVVFGTLKFFCNILKDNLVLGISNNNQQIFKQNIVLNKLNTYTFKINNMGM